MTSTSASPRSTRDGRVATLEPTPEPRRRQRAAAATTTTTAAVQPAPTAPTTAAQATTTTTAAPPGAGTVAGWVGVCASGVLVDRAQLDFVKAKVAAGAQPWKGALDRVFNHGSSVKTAARPSTYRYSSLSYVPYPVTVIRAPSASDQRWLDAHPEYPYKASGDIEHLDDARAAYTHALVWYYTGNQANANKAIEIMNAWSAKITKIEFDVPTPDGREKLWDNGKLEAGWAGSLFARAAEIIRYSGAGWTATNIARFETMLSDVYLPLTITGWSNGANWLMTFAEATTSIGVFTNDRDAFNAGISMAPEDPHHHLHDRRRVTPQSPHPAYDTDAEIRALWHNPDSYIQGLQGETLRDLSHMTMGLGAMTNTAETARIQGVNLYGEQQARILAAYELAARYVNEYMDTGTTPTGWVGDPVDAGGTYYIRGWDIAYNHYARRHGINMPQTKRLVERTRTQDTAALHMTWETLTHTR